MFIDDLVSGFNKKTCRGSGAQMNSSLLSFLGRCILRREFAMQGSKEENSLFLTRCLRDRRRRWGIQLSEKFWKID